MRAHGCSHWRPALLSMSFGSMSQPTRRMRSIPYVAVRCGLSSRTFRTWRRLMYSSASSIIFNESGFGRSEVFNSVDTRQGCSWGSFLYCLTIHPLLKQLADESLRHPSIRRRCPFHWPARANSGSVCVVAFPLRCLAPRRNERPQEQVLLTQDPRGSCSGRRYAHRGAPHIEHIRSWSVTVLLTE